MKNSGLKVDLDKITSKELQDIISRDLSNGRKAISIQNTIITDDWEVNFFKEKLSLYFHNCFFKHITINYQSTENEVLFERCLLRKVLLTSVSNFTITFRDTLQKIEELNLFSVEGKIRLYNAKLSEVCFQAIGKKLNLDCRKSEIDNLDLIDILDKDSHFSFISNTDIQNIKIQGQINSTIWFYGLPNVHNIRVAAFTGSNNRNIRFENIAFSSKKSGVLESLNSRIDNTISFSNCDLSPLKFKIEGSDISGIDYYNTKWPTTFDKDHKDNYQAKETFRQLKKMAENNNDKIEARNYGASELEYYWKYLKSTQSSIWNRIPLFLSKYTNDFGRSWTRALIGLLTTSLLLFLVVIAFHCYGTSFHLFDKILFSGQYFNFLNPVHSIDKILGAGHTELDGWVHFFDFIQRLVSGFYIYQLIRAFRFQYNV